MTLTTSSKTNKGCYFGLLLIALVVMIGIALYNKNHLDLFDKNSLSYPSPWSAGCKSWDWSQFSPSRFEYVPNPTDSSKGLLAIYAYASDLQSSYLALYDLAERKYIRCLIVDDEHWTKLAPNGQILAVGEPNGRIEIRSMVSNALLTTLPGNGTERRYVEFSPNGRLLAIVSADGKLEIRLIESNALLATLPGNGSAPYHVEFSPNSQILAYQVKKSSLWIWDFNRANIPPQELLPGNEWLSDFIFSSNGETLAAVMSNRILQWNTWDWSELPTIRSLPFSYTFRLTELKYTLDGKSLILWNNEEGFMVVDATKGHEIYRWVGSNQNMNFLGTATLSPNGRYFALLGNLYWVDSDSKKQSNVSFLNVWSTENWQYLGQINGDGWGNLTFSPDSQTLATNWKGKIRIMPLAELIHSLKMPGE
jgi:WD40 repeat protein